MDVGRDTFAPYIGDLGNLRPEGMPSPFSLLFLPFYLLLMSNLYLLFCSPWATFFEQVPP